MDNQKENGFGQGNANLDPDIEAIKEQQYYRDEEPEVDFEVEDNDDTVSSAKEETTENMATSQSTAAEQKQEKEKKQSKWSQRKQKRELEKQQKEQEKQQKEREKQEQRERKQREREERKNRKRSKKPMILLILFILGVLVLGGLLYKRYAPSKKVMSLKEFFHAQQGQIVLAFHDQVLEETGIYDGDEMYLPYQVVVDYINQRFYYDSTENILSYATPTEIIRSQVGEAFYTSNKSKMDTDYTIVKSQGEQVYIALDFVKEFSNVEYQFYDNPDRLMIESGWGNEYSYYKVKKDTKLRFKPGIKCDILASLKADDVLRVVNDGTQEFESYAKVMTKDGVTGYALKKYLSDPYTEILSNDYKEVQYPHITEDKTINMVWHQVTTYDANAGLLNALSSTKGVNVVSPTWFSISSNEGEITSLASENYVQQAHNNGVKVWALCDDFKAATDEVSLAQVFGVTSHRDKLVNRLVASAIEYNLDGINIDFEKVKSETAPAYLEFLRELSVKCRVNGIVLSVDTYVPSEYTAYYDREEQGKVVDYIVVMAYDEHYSGGEEAGSVASIGFVKSAIDNIATMADPERVIMGVPFYTRLWKEQELEGEMKITSANYGMSQMENILSQNGVTASWDETTGQNYAEYEADGCRYEVWLEDEQSIQQKLNAIFEKKEDSKNFAGVAFWKLGLEKENIWNTIIKYMN